MSAPFLTVLTTPIVPAPRRAYQRIRSALRPIVKPGVPLPPVTPFPGHYAVTRSVVEGLQTIGADFNYNPRSFDQLARVVYAPAHEALCQAIALTRERRIDYVIAGPVNGLFPSDCDGVLQSPEIDRLIVPSEWVLGFYRDEAPQLIPKTRVCPAGVDAAFWAPSAPTANRVVIYWKSGDQGFCDEVERRAARLGCETTRIRYGAYDRDRFKHALDGAVGAVFLSDFETQGLALAEAWSMDVPTAAWDPQGRAEWRGRAFVSGSSCPYLTRATGTAWRGIDDLDSALGTILRERATFHPRQWVLDHMTDAVCARILYDVIRDGALTPAGAR
jgi:hypothetical protein